MASSGRDEVRRGRNRALAELEKSFEGPIRGLQIAPEFFGLLQSDALQNTPLGQAFNLQQAVFGEVLGGLTGESTFSGRLPGDLASSIGEQVAGFAGGRGTSGSPANAIQAALRFSGASENIRQSRINQALNTLQTIGQGTIFPSASQFLQVGANKASQAANVQFESGQILGGLKSQQNRALTSLVLGGLTGGLAGGFGLLGGSLAGGGLGSILGGAGVGSGLLPGSLFASSGGSPGATQASVGTAPAGFNAFPQGVPLTAGDPRQLFAQFFGNLNFGGF